MNHDSMFAIVDIETTGTNLEKDKIIQFACVLVEHGKIVNQFSTDVNPLKPIPKNIELLTGITNKQVANAPYFEDVAHIIAQLLDGCVFVAHNVYFDYTFLNSELRRADEAELQLECVDTVELSQVTFPQSVGYRVSDLADFLHINHDNPHQALSDAYVTAEILIEITKKLEQLPLVTLERMVSLSDVLGMNNVDFLTMIYEAEKKNSNRSLQSELYVIEGVALREKEYQFREKEITKEIDYPINKKQKIALFDDVIKYRAPQSDMMDEVHHFIESPDKDFIIEASTGIGKTLGYLFPLSLRKSKRQPVVISTATILLEEQLLNNDLPLLNQLTKKNELGVLLKSQSHYLDLQKFYQTLEQPLKQKQYALYQMAVLVWLLETKTGDLDEINLNKRHVFYEHVCHRGVEELNPNSSFIEEDFLNYLKEKKEVADYIIVNHAFLCEENKRERQQIPEAALLVIDEAQKLLSVLENKGLTHFSMKHGFYLLKYLKESDDLISMLKDKQKEPLLSIVNMISLLAIELRECMEWLSDFILQNYSFTEKVSEQVFTECEYNERWPRDMKKNIKQLMVLGRELRQLSLDVKSYYQEEKAALIESNYFLVSDYLNVLENMNEWLDSFRLFFNDFNQGQVKWIKFKKNQLIFSAIDFSQLTIEQTSWYQSFKKIIYTGGTLQLDVNSDYFEKKLGLEKVAKVKINDHYHYDESARLFVVKPDTYSLKTGSNEFANYISEVIYKTYLEQEKSILVLFTSHDLLGKVYHLLHPKLYNHDVEILGQGVTGTKEKIVKRFSKIDKGIILGANSFWEGIDFPDQRLEIVIMTKLPFDPPTRPIVEARYDYIASKGGNPFYDEAIPQAGMRLRQGIGRLLRSETDKGVMILLDNRLLESSYGQTLATYLPKGLPVKSLGLSDMLKEINEFL